LLSANNFHLATLPPDKIDLCQGAIYSVMGARKREAIACDTTMEIHQNHVQQPPDDKKSGQNPVLCPVTQRSFLWIGVTELA
jgi:hypothetical protein